MEHRPQGSRLPTNLVDPLREPELSAAGEFGTWATSDEHGSTHCTPPKSPAYESRPNSLQEEDKPGVRRPPFHQRLSGFCKPAKQHPDTQELKQNTSLGGTNSRAKSHRKAASLGISIGYPVSTIDNGKGAPPPPLAVSDHARRPSYPFALPSGWIKRVATPTRDMTSLFLPSSNRAVITPPAPQVASPFTTSVSAAEGMLHPNASIRVQLKGSVHSHTCSENYVSHDGDGSGESRFSSFSNRSKTSSVIRPLSGIFNKSSDVLTDGLWSQRPPGKLARSWSSSPTAHSREGSFYFESNTENVPIPVKSKSWAKLLNGYVSPRSSLLAHGSRRRKSVRQTDFDLSINSRKRGRSIREVVSPILRAQSRRRSSDSTSLRQSVCIVTTPKKSVVSTCNSRALLCAVLLHILLFWICPPSQAIALGGYGMLVVYGMLALGLVSISWTAFEDETLVSPREPTHQSPQETLCAL